MELTRELQESVSWPERKAYPLIVLLRRRENESTLRHAVRASASNLVTYIALGMTAAVFHLIAVTLRGDFLESRSGVNVLIGIRVVAALGIWESVSVGLFVLIGPAMSRQLETGLLRPRSWLQVGVISLLAVTTVFACGAGFLSMMPISAADVTRLLPRWLLLALVTPPIFVMLGRLAAVEALRSRPWTTLDISA